jgi:hypothetical protein
MIKVYFGIKGGFVYRMSRRLRTQYSEKLIIPHTPFTMEEIRCIKISRFHTGGTGWSMI